MRVVLIDPKARTVTEEQVDGALDVLEMMGLTQDAPTRTPVENSQTGDKIYVSAIPGPRAERFRFLGDEYRGRAVIAGRDISEDAAVPLERVRSQVRWPS